MCKSEYSFKKITVMEKVIVPINVSQFNKEVIEFACYITQLTGSGLTGLFLEDLQEDEVPVRKTIMGNPYIETIVAEDIVGNRNRKALCEQSMKLFRQICETREIKFSMLSKAGDPVDEVIAATRYADLLVMDAETTFGDIREPVPTRFTQEILEGSECPVAIAPYEFSGIMEIVFAFDGKASSVFAMKQFTYLFPELQNRTIRVLHVSEENSIEQEEKEKLKEFLELHYSNILFEELQGKPSDELFGYLLKRKEAFVVMGAFSRSLISKIFKRSTATLVLEAVNLPVFIAHK
jgi:nucleotide-binding universal stress UspA family protein